MNDTQWAGVGMLGVFIYLILYFVFSISKNKKLHAIGEVMGGLLMGAVLLLVVAIIGSMIFFPNLF